MFNELVLVLQEIFCGLATEGVKFMYRLQRRAKRGTDTTEYGLPWYVPDDWAAQMFIPHYSQLLSAAVVVGDAKRSLRRINTLKTNVANGSLRRPTPDRRGSG